MILFVANPKYHSATDNKTVEIGCESLAVRAFAKVQKEKQVNPGVRFTCHLVFYASTERSVERSTVRCRGWASTVPRPVEDSARSDGRDVERCARSYSSNAGRSVFPPPPP